MSRASLLAAARCFAARTRERRGPGDGGCAGGCCPRPWWISAPKREPRLVQAQWRYSDVKIVEVDHHEPGSRSPRQRARRTEPTTSRRTPGGRLRRLGVGRRLTPAALERRRSHGRLAFNWYRTRITLPEKVGDFDVAGSTVVLELVLDDYAEIWVDGKLPLVLGQTGGQLIKGFNAPNRVVLTRDAHPGQQIQLADLRHQRPDLPAAGQLHLGALGHARLLSAPAGGRRQPHPGRRSCG